MEKTLLLIDDSPDQKGVLENLSEHLRVREGINISNFYINPNDRPFLNDQKDPDLEKLIQGITQQLIGKKPDLIIVDLYYSDNELFDGLLVIEKLRLITKFRNCKIFLISGKREKVIRDIFENEKKDTKEKVKNLAKIIDFRIEKFLDKNFKDEAIESLKRKNIDNILPSKLRDFEKENEIKINLFSPRFKTLTLEELAEKIESNDPEASQILNEMFELTLSHYINIDEGLQ
jgi:CheY-like chemotaxis protein